MQRPDELKETCLVKFAAIRYNSVRGHKSTVTNHDYFLI